MTEAVSVWLPFPPSVNNLFAHGMVGGKVRRFPTSKYKSWRKEALVRLQVARLPKFTGPVAVRLAITPPSAARRDVDNYSKAVLDALVEARVLSDDSQVQKLLSAWDSEGTEPGVWVDIGPTDTEQKPLSASERAALRRLRHEGVQVLSVGRSMPAAARALVDRGLAEEVPGLFEGFPQGVVVAK